METIPWRVWMLFWGAVIAAVWITYDRQNKSVISKTRKEKKLKQELVLEHLMKKSEKSAGEHSDGDDDYMMILKEIQLGENFMLMDHYEAGVRHFANAIQMSADPYKLIHSLQKSLPENAFDLLIELLSKASKLRAKLSD